MSVAETRMKIHEAAARVFSQRGFHRATVEQIATQAGVAKGSVYSYHDSKESLFCALIDRLAEELWQAVQRALSEGRGAGMKIEGAIVGVLAAFEAQPDLARVALVEAPAAGANAAERAARAEGFFLEAIARNIDLLAREGRVDVDPALAAALILGSLKEAVLRWLRGELDGPLAGYGPTVARYHTMGLGLREGGRDA